MTRRSRLTLGISVLLLSAAFLVGSASARNHSCAKSGYKLAEAGDGYFILYRDRNLRSWEDGPYRYLACSIAYGKFVRLTETGLDGDGESYLSSVDGNPRYLSFVTGFSGNAGGGEDEEIALVDLKTGKTMMRRHVDAEVSAMALSEGGKLGWITTVEEAVVVNGESDLNDIPVVYLRTAKKVRRVAKGPEIDPHFLKFGDEGRRLIWSTKTSSAPTS